MRAFTVRIRTPPRAAFRPLAGESFFQEFKKNGRSQSIKRNDWKQSDGAQENERIASRISVTHAFSRSCREEIRSRQP